MALFDAYCHALKMNIGVTCLPDPNAVTNMCEDYSKKWPWSEYTYAGHLGVDFGTNFGSAKYPVYALHDGIVSDVYNNPSNLGRGIGCEIGNGTIAFRYMHFSELHVKKGQSVKKGQQIGVSGASGYGVSNYYFPHLHIDCWENPYGWVDPYFYIVGAKEIPGQAKPTTPVKPEPGNTDNPNIAPTPGTGYIVQTQDGVFTANTTIRARVEPNVDKPYNSKENLQAGQSLTYDKYVRYGEYTWLRNVKNGYWYAWRVTGGETFGTIK